MDAGNHERDTKAPADWLKNRQNQRYQTKSEQKVKVEKDAAEDLADAIMGVDAKTERGAN